MPERAAAVRLAGERSAKSIKADAKQPEVPAPAKRIHSGAAPALGAAGAQLEEDTATCLSYETR